jgi:anti-sigma B factor antagonist
VGGFPIIDLQGDLDSPAEAVLNSAYRTAMSQDPPAIVLDFRNVKFMNSKGIALIVEMLTRLRKAGRHLLVFGLNNHYRQLFEITRLTEYISVHGDESGALAAAMVMRVEEPVLRKE